MSPKGNSFPANDLIRLNSYVEKQKMITLLKIDKMSKMDVKRAEKISKALSDPTRLKILSEIKKKNDCLYCSELYDSVNLAQPSISHHLKQLTDSDIIVSQKEGRNIRYRMNKEVLDDYIQFLEELKK